MSFQIETERLIIRDVIEEDVPTLLAQYLEPESKANILANNLVDTKNKEILINAMVWAKQSQRLFYKLSVILKEDQNLIGSCEISNVRPECFKTSIGWHYSHQFRGNGYATEAARELLKIGFELNQVNEIYADCFIGNHASIRVLEKIGMRRSWDFTPINILRGWGYGENKPTVRHIITRYQWLSAGK